MTTSELQFTPQVGDVGRMLSCEAVSPSVTTRPLVDDWLLDVHCEYEGPPPRVIRKGRRREACLGRLKERL